MKTKPLKHQAEAFERFANEDYWALWWEPGVGKSWAAIAVACELHKRGKIDRVVVIAPKLVHTNWITDELPKHAEPGWAGVAWQTHKAKQKGQQGDCVRLLKHDGLKVLAISYNGLCTEAGRDVVRTFVAGGPTMMVVDEMHRIKTPTAERSKLTIKAGKLPNVKVRVGLTGTPITQSPFDVYNEVMFLDATYWKRLGIGGYTAFKEEFGVPKLEFWGGRKVITYPEYRNLDKLHAHMARIGHRLRRIDAIDLPPQVFVKRKFKLAPEQRRVYDEIKAQFQAELQDGTVIEAPLALTRLMRLHQIACGFTLVDPGLGVCTDDGVVIASRPIAKRICDEMPRLDALEEVLEDLKEPTIIWTRFRNDAEVVMRRLNKCEPRYVEGELVTPDCPPLGPVAGRVDGTVKDADRDRVIAAFRAGKIQYLVANPQAMGIGITLNEAKACVYYSQDLLLEPRLQSEARNYRVGQDRGVYVVDLVAEGTVDEKAIDALVQKHDISALVVGDKFREWIR